MTNKPLLPPSSLLTKDLHRYLTLCLNDRYFRGIRLGDDELRLILHLLQLYMRPRGEDAQLPLPISPRDTAA